MSNELIKIETSEVQPLLEKSIMNVRDEIKDNPQNLIKFLQDKNIEVVM